MLEVFDERLLQVVDRPIPSLERLFPVPLRKSWSAASVCG